MCGPRSAIRPDSAPSTKVRALRALRQSGFDISPTSRLGQIIHHEAVQQRPHTDEALLSEDHTLGLIVLAAEPFVRLLDGSTLRRRVYDAA